MIALEDRQALAHDIDTAHISGARLRPACEIVGIDVRTLQRWKAQDGLTAGDGRPWAVRPTPSHALSPTERAALLAVANEPRFASVPPARIVPMLADEGVYLGSESSMARVLREHGQNARRGRAKAPPQVTGQIGLGFGLADRRMFGIAEVAVANRPIPCRANVWVGAVWIGLRHAVESLEALGELDGCTPPNATPFSATAPPLRSTS